MMRLVRIWVEGGGGSGGGGARELEDKIQINEALAGGDYQQNQHLSHFGVLVSAEGERGEGAVGSAVGDGMGAGSVLAAAATAASRASASANATTKASISGLSTGNCFIVASSSAAI